MACMSKDIKKGYRIAFSLNGQRKSFRPGIKVPEDECAVIKSHVEELLLSFELNRDLSEETATWLGSISDKMHLKISRTGLIAPRNQNNPFKFSPSVGGLQLKVRDLEVKIKMLERELENLMECTRVEIKESKQQ